MAKSIVLYEITEVMLHLGLADKFIKSHNCKYSGTPNKKERAMNVTPSLLLIKTKNCLVQVFRYLFAHRVYFVMNHSNEFTMFIQ